MFEDVCDNITVPVGTTNCTEYYSRTVRLAVEGTRHPSLHASALREQLCAMLLQRRCRYANLTQRGFNQPSPLSCANSQTPSASQLNVHQRPTQPIHGRSDANCPRCRRSLGTIVLELEPVVICQSVSPSLQCRRWIAAVHLQRKCRLRECTGTLA